MTQTPASIQWHVTLYKTCLSPTLVSGNGRTPTQSLSYSEIARVLAPRTLLTAVGAHASASAVD